MQGYDDEWRQRLSRLIAERSARKLRHQARREAFAAARRAGLPKRQAAKLAAEARRWCAACGPGYRYGDEGCQHTEEGNMTGAMTLSALAAKAAEIELALVSAGFTERPWVRQTLALSEEAGEFVGAVRRWSGNARRQGTFAEVKEELADVVITAFVTANTLNIDLPAEISKKLDVLMTRGWREVPGAGNADSMSPPRSEAPMGGGS